MTFFKGERLLQPRALTGAQCKGSFLLPVLSLLALKQMLTDEKENNRLQYCAGCKKKHSLKDVGGYLWESKKIGKKTIYWCRMAIDCTGCGFVHARGFYTFSNSDGTWCEKWKRERPRSMEQKMAGMSPEEVMSGVQHGGEVLPYFKGKSSNDYSVEQSQQKKALKEALS